MIWRKLENLGLAEMYMSDNNFARIISMVFIINFVPGGFLYMFWPPIIEMLNQIDVDPVFHLVEYLTNTFIGSNG